MSCANAIMICLLTTSGTSSVNTAMHKRMRVHLSLHAWTVSYPMGDPSQNPLWFTKAVSDSGSCAARALCSNALYCSAFSF